MRSVTEDLKALKIIKEYDVVTDYEKDTTAHIEEILPACCKRVEDAIKDREELLDILRDIICIEVGSSADDVATIIVDGGVSRISADDFNKLRKAGFYIK